jgi:hypothetical protein
MREHPRSPEAYTARVAAAALHLEHLGDPRGALSLYQAALAGGGSGALSEEARWGIAACNRALGDRAAEASALRAFVAAHPHSLMLPHAQRRLEELSNTDP